MEDRNPKGAGRDREKKRRVDRDSIARKRAGQRGLPVPPSGEENLRRIKKLLEDNGVAPEDIGAVKAVRLNEWEVAAKTGPKGGPKTLETRTLTAASIVLEPTWATGPQWPLVEPGKPVTVRVPRVPVARGPALLRGWESILLIPDVQMGYRRLMDGTLDPFHDERVLDLIVQVAELERPDGVINVGDFQDFAAMSSKFRKEAGFAQTTQAGLDRGVEFLFTLAELTKWQKLISGNHDVRLQNYLIDNAKSAFGLRPGLSKPDTWPDLSIQRLLRLDEAKCEYVGSYPAGATYINDNLAAVHGKRLGSGGRTQAQVVVDDERVSVVMGHSHKRSLAAKTRNSRGQPKFSIAYCPGCACRIDGAVPSTNSNIDGLQETVRAWEDWQQGFAVVRYQPGDGKFLIEEIPVFEGWGVFEKQELFSRVDMYRSPVAEGP